MTVTNIYPVNKIGPDMIRQPVEMYLPFQILKNKDKYLFLSQDKLNHIKSYKIVDTGVGDPQYSKGKPCQLIEQLEAAAIIGADEITLTDEIRFSNGEMKPTRESSILSYKAYIEFMKNYQQDYPDINLAWVMQAEDFNEWVNTLRIVVDLDYIETIMIPKWECYTSLWGKINDHTGRQYLSRIIRDVEKHSVSKKHHRIHWLGNCNSSHGYGLRECIIAKSEQTYLDVQSTDTGLFVAELAQTGKYDLLAGRPMFFEIDLINAEFDWTDIEKLIRDQNLLLDMQEQ